MLSKSCFRTLKYVRQAGSVRRLNELGIKLPNVMRPIANYETVVKHENLLYLSGVIPVRADGSFIRGKIGLNLDERQGYEAAKQAAITALAIMKHHLGSFDNVVRLIRVTGYVNCISTFEDTPFVLNGASDLFVNFFEDSGKHARSAIGVHTLPMGVPVEMDIIAEIRNCPIYPEVLE
ncbi:hypothetical protein WA158_003189 [Blastocystis sp. Blastoise]